MIATVAAVIAYIPAGLLATKVEGKKDDFNWRCAIVSFLRCCFCFYELSLDYDCAFCHYGNRLGGDQRELLSYGCGDGKRLRHWEIYWVLLYFLNGCTDSHADSFRLLLEQVGYWTLFPYAVLLWDCLLHDGVRHGDSRPVAPKDKLEMLDVED